MMSSNVRLAALLPASLLLATPAWAAPADDAAAAISAILDKFNAGDAKAFVDAHTADAVLVDEFAPHVWQGTGSAGRWLDDYGKYAEAAGISGASVAHGTPLQAASDGKGAYIVLPTTLTFAQGGKKMSASGSMTFVMSKEADNWKIRGWTYSAPAAAPVAP
ncbi:nuclear transport factor 2 family protein [Sphingomonas arenae]|uniref:nuclear transport factor 2 family protein n=1 Tax=Sphingomonas arenae TaxID=2812555 RepID=UPI0019683D66|nr:nuclear transport factor 2 family protein [Sphingomonas arenae]